MLERVGAFRPDLDQYNERIAVVVLVSVCTHGMDGRSRNRYRNRDLRKSDTFSQILTTLGWTLPLRYRYRVQYWPRTVSV